MTFIFIFIEPLEKMKKQNKPKHPTPRNPSDQFELLGGADVL